MIANPQKMGGRNDLCDICQKRHAKYFEAAIVDGVMVGLKLCKPCKDKREGEALWF